MLHQKKSSYTLSFTIFILNKFPVLKKKKL